MTLEKIFTGFLSSEEYVKKNKTELDYVTDLYSCILNRRPDVRGLTDWENRLRTSGLTRKGIIQLFVSSPEFQTQIGLKVEAATGYSKRSSYSERITWPKWEGMYNVFSTSTGVQIKMNLTEPAKTACNIGAFTTSPLLNGFWVSRAYTRGCPRPENNNISRWQLIGHKATWQNDSITKKDALVIDQVNTVFDPTRGSTNTLIDNTVIGDGNKINQAYDPFVMDFNGETWIVFVCTGFKARSNTILGPSNCIGPLIESTNDQHRLDVSRTRVIVENNFFQLNGKRYQNTGGVPSLIFFKGKAYLYWVSVHFNTAVSNWGKNYSDPGNYIITRGIEIGYDPITTQLYPKDRSGNLITEPFFASDPRSVVVFDRILTDPKSDRTADMHYVVTDGNYIYANVTSGGGRCLTPLSPEPGCYRDFVTRTKNPLAYNTFRSESVGPSVFPGLYQSYRRFFYRPDTDSTWLIGTNFVVQNEKYLEAGLPIPKAKPAGAWAFPWPDNIMKPK